MNKIIFEIYTMEKSNPVYCNISCLHNWLQQKRATLQILFLSELNSETYLRKNGGNGKHYSSGKKDKSLMAGNIT